MLWMQKYMGAWPKCLQKKVEMTKTYQNQELNNVTHGPHLYESWTSTGADCLLFAKMLRGLEHTYTHPEGENCNNFPSLVGMYLV